MEYSLNYLSYDKEYLVNALEAVLFVGGEPVGLDRLSQLFDITKTEVSLVADSLEKRLLDQRSSFQLVHLGDTLQLCTKTEYASIVQQFLEIKRTTPISKAALEALSIVAYKQPVTRLEIEKVRGVSCDFAINKLLEYDLITELGRLDAPGRPILFGTTEQFLRSFGVKSLEELPEMSTVQLEEFKAQAEAEAQQLKLDI